MAVPSSQTRLRRLFHFGNFKGVSNDMPIETSRGVQQPNPAPSSRTSSEDNRRSSSPIPMSSRPALANISNRRPASRSNSLGKAPIIPVRRSSLSRTENKENLVPLSKNLDIDFGGVTTETYDESYILHERTVNVTNTTRNTRFGNTKPNNFTDNATQQSFALPDVQDLSELVSGVYQESTAAISQQPKPRNTRFASPPTAAADGSRPSEHIPIDTIPIPDDEKAIISSLKLLEEKVLGLEVEVTKLKQENLDLEIQNRTLKFKKLDLKERIFDLEIGLYASTRCISAHEATMSDLTKERDSAVSQLGIERVNSEALMAEMQTLHQENDELQRLRRENKELHAATLQLHDRLDVTDRSISAHEYTVSDLTKERDSAVSQLGIERVDSQALKAEMQRLRQENDKLHSVHQENEELHTAALQLRELLDITNQSISAHEYTVSDLTKERDSVVSQLETERVSSQGLKTEIQRLHRENDELHAALNNLTEERDSAISKLGIERLNSEKLKTEMQRLHRENEELQRLDRENKEALCREFKTEKETLCQSNDDLRGANVQLQSRLEIANRQISVHDAAMKKMKKTVKNVTKERDSTVKALIKERNSVARQLNQAQISCRALEIERDGVMEVAYSKCTDLQARLDVANNQISEYEAIAKNVTPERDSTGSQSGIANLSSEELKMEKEALRRENDEWEDQPVVSSVGCGEPTGESTGLTFLSFVDGREVARVRKNLEEERIARKHGETQVPNGVVSDGIPHYAQPTYSSVQHHKEAKCPKLAICRRHMSDTLIYPEPAMDHPNKESRIPRSAPSSVYNGR